MNIDNGKISERQCFRIGVLENIALGIVVIPYVTTNIAGEWHLPALLLGLIFTATYGIIIFGLTKVFPEGFIEYVEESLGLGGKLIQVFYLFRYVLRAGFIIILFGAIIQQYMLRSYNMWWIILPFVLISGYGGTRDIEKRGRLLELLFWWMIVPLIVVAVFSISNIDWNVLPDMARSFLPKSMGNSGNKIFLGGYVVLIIFSTLELMLFTLTKQRKNNWENGLKILLWVIIAVVFAHIYIIGILGRDWTGSSSYAAFSVMEASTLPGGAVERLDYPVLAFWIIGIFAIASGYMYYSKELVNGIFCEENPKSKVLSMPLVIILCLLFSYLWSIENVAKYFTWYLIWMDLAVSIVVPVVIGFVKDKRVSNILVGTIKRVKNIFIITIGVGLAMVLTACNSVDNTRNLTQGINSSYKPLEDKRESIENRDYATSIEVKVAEDGDKVYSFKIETVDLSEYKGGSEGNMKTKEYQCEENGMKEAIEKYYSEKERELDLGHISEIKLDKTLSDENIKDIVLELSTMPSVAKSVEVSYQERGNEKKILLRELIKTAYTGEDF